MRILKLLKLLVVPALVVLPFVHKGQAVKGQQELDALLKKSNVKFQKKVIKEIYLAGPNKTYNVGGVI